MNIRARMNFSLWALRILKYRNDTVEEDKVGAALEPGDLRNRASGLFRARHVIHADGRKSFHSTRVTFWGQESQSLSERCVRRVCGRRSLLSCTIREVLIRLIFARRVPNPDAAARALADSFRLGESVDPWMKKFNSTRSWREKSRRKALNP